MSRAKSKKTRSSSSLRSGTKSRRDKWVQNVKTVSTFPPKDLFTKDAGTIARVMGSRKVSPKGIGSGIRMIQYFINRSGKQLSEKRKQVLEHAKHLLQTKQKRNSG